jgi:DNA-binding transcriptional ArsR family regulator
LSTPPTTTLPSGSDVALIAAADNDGCSLPEAQALLSALAEPNRLEILRLVWRRELPAGQIAARFHLTRTAVSGHLRVMERAGLLARRSQGSLRLYRARPERIAALWSFFAALR